MTIHFYQLRDSRPKRYDLSGLFELLLQTSKIVFSGIIEDLGKVADLRLGDAGAVLSIHSELPVAKIKIGDSVSVNGACLTVIAKGRGLVKMDVSAETLRRTTLGELKSGDRVNLERCLTLGTLLNGQL